MFAWENDALATLKELLEVKKAPLAKEAPELAVTKEPLANEAAEFAWAKAAFKYGLLKAETVIVLAYMLSTFNVPLIVALLDTWRAWLTPVKLTIPLATRTLLSPAGLTLVRYKVCCISPMPWATRLPEGPISTKPLNKELLETDKAVLGSLRYNVPVGLVKSPSYNTLMVSTISLVLLTHCPKVFAKLKFSMIAMCVLL